MSEGSIPSKTPVRKYLAPVENGWKDPGVDLFSTVDAAAAAVRGKSSVKPLVGVVLGSGLGAFAERIENRVAVP
jgi:hypothetical protein